MLGVYTRILKDKWKSLLIYIAASVAFLEMYIALYPSMKAALQSTEELMKAFPKEFMGAFGFTPEVLTFPTIESFISTEMFTLMWPIVAIIIAIGLANLSFAGDIAAGTIEVVLAQPISRLKVFIARYLAGASIILVFVWTSIYAAIPLTAMHGIVFNAKSYLYMSIIGSLFVLAIYGLAVLFSALFSEKGKTIFATTGVLITMYAINIVSGLNDKFGNLKYFSFFYYFNPGTALNKLGYVEWAIPFFLGVILITPVLGAFWFHRRDIAT